MKITLTNEQKQEFKTQHSTIRDGRVRDRKKAVIYASNGWSPEEIADTLLIHESTVRQHIKDYLQSNKLKPENDGSQGYLSTHQTQELVQYLTENTYHHAYEIVAYVLERSQVQYSVPGMNKWLYHNRFSYKQPKDTPHRFNRGKQQAFIEDYETLKASCGKGESIVFIDAVYPTLSSKISHGWMRTVQDKVLDTTGNRSRLNLVGALNLSDIRATIVSDYESINSENIIRFFCNFKDSYPLEHRLHIILDGAGYHRSDLVKDAAFFLNIGLHNLPPYSINLNPIGRLWKVMNKKSRNNVYFKNKRDFKAAIGRFFTVILPEIAGSLVPRINDNFQVLKPEPSS
ncbi:IS630 family transposase [Vibrio nigripulchritudo]|uniref:IS630 family transposase n=1 Tax=Vibrio nigripulchritudo TaxID=28173 RepID=UPI0018C86067|nr:IS630 family transposase [Vibrio nigripulchritudo]